MPDSSSTPPPEVPQWRWLPGASRYYSFDTHRIISAAQVRDWAWKAIETSKDAISALTDKLVDGGLQTADWQTLMRRQIKDEYIRQYLLGRGGLQAMTQADWGSIGGQLAESYRYLDGFAADIAGGNLTPAQITARANMYLNSSQEAFWRATIAATGCPPLDAYPGDGSTKCLCCLSLEQRILTPSGWVPLGDIRLGDLVLTHKGRFRPVTGLVVKPSLPCTREARVLAPTGEWVRVTADHLWYTVDGWRNASDIDSLCISMYTVDHDKTMQYLRGANALGQPTRSVQEVPIGLSLRQTEGLSGSGMFILRDEPQGVEAVAATIHAREDGAGHPGSGRSEAHTLRGLVRFYGVANQAAGWQALDVVLAGRQGSEDNDLPLPVALDQGQWPDSQGLRCSPQGRGSHQRQYRESRVDQRQPSFSFAWCHSTPACSGTPWDADLSPMREGILPAHASREAQPVLFSGVPGCLGQEPLQGQVADRQVRELRYGIPAANEGRGEPVQILFTDLLLGTPLYDIVVAEDHSFVIEGLVSHNTNCKCSLNLLPIHAGRKTVGWQVFWKLGPVRTEHCDTDEVNDDGSPRGCVQRAALWNPLILWMPDYEPTGKETGMKGLIAKAEPPRVMGRLFVPSQKAFGFTVGGRLFVPGVATDIKGGPGSGFRGHEGRPGKRGGSLRAGVQGSRTHEPPAGWEDLVEISPKDFRSPDENTDEEVMAGTAHRLAARWQVDRADVVAYAKEGGWKIPTEWNDDKVKRAFVENELRHWGSSSGSPLSVGSAAHVCDRIGSPYHRYSDERDAQRWMAHHPAEQRVVNSLGDAMYDFTQEWLRERGVTQLHLMRAGKPRYDRPFSSWSLDWGGMRHDPNIPNSYEVVPAKYILSVPSTGFGTMHESEVVVLARPKSTAKAFAFDAGGRTFVADGQKGGPGSGFRGHRGRPGKRGGSAAAGGVHGAQALSDAEVETLWRWTGDNYDALSTESATYISPTMLRALDKLPSYHGNLQRFENESFVGKVGDVLDIRTLRSFAQPGSSLERTRGWYSPTRLIIKAGTGKDIQGYSWRPQEKEVLMQPGVKLRVLRIRRVKLPPGGTNKEGVTQTVVYLEQVDAAVKGGPGSGFRGHHGRPGKRGGSAAANAAATIERAPFESAKLTQRRHEAVERIAEWRKDGRMSDLEIAADGYKWRKWTRDRPDSTWDWAMWEQIQGVAQEIGYKYKSPLTEDDIFNDPTIDADGLLRGENWSETRDLADTVVTGWRNNNQAGQFLRFMDTPEGQRWQHLSQRNLWGEVVANAGRPIIDSLGASHSLHRPIEPFPGAQALRKAKSFAEAKATEITVYRGETDHYVARARSIQSWTTSPDVARMFAESYYHSYNEPGAGKVIERKVRLGDIAGYLNPDGEFEVLLRDERKGEKGGPGSGFRGHVGRPGKRGGSQRANESPSASIAATQPKQRQLASEYLRAYLEGQKFKGRDMQEAVWSGDLDWMGGDVDAWALLDMGMRNYPLQWVEGWRYGNIPASGRSTNYREQQAESGVSVMALRKGGETQDKISAMFFTDRPIVYVHGLLSDKHGSDGEPLLLFAKQADYGTYATGPVEV